MYHWSDKVIVGIIIAIINFILGGNLVSWAAFMYCAIVFSRPSSK